VRERHKKEVNKVRAKLVREHGAGSGEQGIREQGRGIEEKYFIFTIFVMNLEVQNKKFN
jgi:hypothetical protein